MNHSRIKASVAALAVAALVGLSACGGGSDGLSKADEEALQAELAAAEEAKRQAEEAQRQAELEQARAEAAAEEARRQRQAEEQARQAAEERRRQEEEARQAAEAEQQRLREEAQQERNRAQSGKALTGLRAATASNATAIGAVTVTPKYSAVADVTATPTDGSAVNFASKSRSSSGGWSVTTLSNAGFTHNDQLVVYSNRGGPTRILLTQEYSTRFTDSDTETANTPISASISSADGRLIKSGSFPTKDGDDKPFPHNFENDSDSEGFDIVRISGSFDGASGHFQCSGTCTIGKRGDRFVVTGSWTFHTTDAARVLVDDKSYAYFGWWRREQKSDESLSYLSFNGISEPTDDQDRYKATSDAENFNLLGDSATYRGPAIGQYAIYQPLGTQSATGAFTANAVLTADFSSNNLSGTVTNFSHDSSWSLALNQASMAGGAVTTAGTVDWTIAGNTSARQGAWKGTFFSESEYVGQVPDAFIGDFTAIYDADADTGDDIGRIIGVFGARK